MATVAGPVTPLLGQFEVIQGQRAAALAKAFTRVTSADDQSVIPAIRQATVVSVDGGLPPTVTLSYDGVNNLSGIRYLTSYSPAVGDVVETIVRSGNPWILGTGQLIEPPFTALTFDFGADVTHAAGVSGDYVTYTFTLVRPAWVRIDFRCNVRPNVAGNVNFTNLSCFHPTGTLVRQFPSEGLGQSGGMAQEITGWYEFYSTQLTSDTLRVSKGNAGSSAGPAVFSRFISDMSIHYR